MEGGNQTGGQMISNTTTTTGSLESSENEHCDPTDFEVSDFIMFDGNSDDLSTMVSGYLHNHGHAMKMSDARDVGIAGISSCLNLNLNQGESSTRGGANRSTEGEAKVRIAFKTKSEIDALDDGFKWRKYGKKMVKNNPNPRNYYRCSVNGCPVKKRIERDGDDPRYVITTYEGIHSHQTCK